MSDPHPWGDPLPGDEPEAPRSARYKLRPQTWVTNLHPTDIAKDTGRGIRTDIVHWWRHGGQ